MRKYQLNIPTTVRRQLNNLPGRYRQRVQRMIAELTMNPRPSQAKLLRDSQNRYRLRLDEYRIVYRVEDELLLIEVVKVGQKEGPEFYEDVD